MPDSPPLLLFEVYRWAGTAPEEFAEHYRTVHAEIGTRLPGVVWYESFLNKAPTGDWPTIGSRPEPDAFVIMMFDSQESLENLPNTPEWDEAARDDIGFCSHFKSYAVDRFTWIPDPEKREAYAFAGADAG